LFLETLSFESEVFRDNILDREERETMKAWKFPNAQKAFILKQGARVSILAKAKSPQRSV
jgi:hypothetical protein